MANQVADSQNLKDQQKRDWDAAAAGWQKWWPIFERAAQHVSDRLVELAGVRPGSRVLDVATGSGEPAVTAARRAMPAGRVLATDQSPGMLAIARQRADELGINNLEFRESDGEALNIEERDFDAVLCRWGLMFMPDLPRAIAGLRAHMVAGGRIAAAVWSTADKVPMISLGAETVRKLAGLPSPQPGALEPLRLADPAILTKALEQAGFKDVKHERLTVNFEFQAAGDFVRFRQDVSATFRALLAKRTPQLREQIVNAITEAARVFADTEGRVRTANETILFSAHT